MLNRFNRKKEDPASKAEPQAEEIKDLDEEELTPAERAYLDKLQKTAGSGSKKEALEAELRRRERERIEREYDPANPLYKQSRAPVNESAGGGTKSPGSKKPAEKNSYQNDPRYKSFYEKIRKRTNREPSKYDEEIQPLTLEELEQQGWDGAPKKPEERPEPLHRKAAGPTPEGENPPSGTIIKFDDDSVAIYKSSVSGKDYALCYFMEPHGALSPRGIFLQQYEWERIGQLPEEQFERMRKEGNWDRDAVIFHLDAYEFASVIRKLENRTPYFGAGTHRYNGTDSHSPEAPDAKSGGEKAIAAGRPQRNRLERGRALRINVGGRVWESVYWTEDEIGTIVAHNTNGQWSLMHLDLSRFEDTLEYGDLLEPERLSEIEKSLVTQSS